MQDIYNNNFDSRKINRLKCNVSMICTYRL